MSCMDRASIMSRDLEVAWFVLFSPFSDFGVFDFEFVGSQMLDLY